MFRLSILLDFLYKSGSVETTSRLVNRTWTSGFNELERNDSNLDSRTATEQLLSQPYWIFFLSREMYKPPKDLIIELGHMVSTRWKDMAPTWIPGHFLTNLFTNPIEFSL